MCQVLNRLTLNFPQSTDSVLKSLEHRSFDQVSLRVA